MSDINSVTLSGLINGEFTPVSKDGVQFTVSIPNQNSQDLTDDFLVVAYGNSAQFLKQNAQSGYRVVLEGRLSSEKLDTDNYHVVVSTVRVLDINSNPALGRDFTLGTVSGLASCKEVSLVGAKSTPVASLNINNQRTYTKEGESFTYTTYLGASLWKDLAESVSSYVPFTDQRVLVVGVLKPRSYENSNGARIYKVDIWANNVYYLSEVPNGVPSENAQYGKDENPQPKTNAPQSDKTPKTKRLPNSNQDPF